MAEDEVSPREPVKIAYMAINVGDVQHCWRGNSVYDILQALGKLYERIGLEDLKMIGEEQARRAHMFRQQPTVPEQEKAEYIGILDHQTRRRR